MVTFDNEQLFGPGPARFKFGALKLRHAAQSLPGSRGVHLDPQGTQARQIFQAGTLISDSPDGLRKQVAAVEAKVDGLSHTLIDNLGQSWPDTVMLEFKAEAFTRVGARWKAAYQVEYLQVVP